MERRRLRDHLDNRRRTDGVVRSQRDPNDVSVPVGGFRPDDRSQLELQLVLLDNGRGSLERFPFEPRRADVLHTGVIVPQTNPAALDGCQG